MNANGNLELRKEKMPETFEMEDQTLFYIKKVGSTIVIFVDKISSTRCFQRRRHISERQRRIGTQCFGLLTNCRHALDSATMPLNTMRVSPRDGRT